jgi:Flp pilus assembly protein TadD
VVNFNLGLLAARRGDSAEAASLFGLALRFDPDNPGTMNNVAYHVARSGGDLAEAERLAREAVRRDPIAEHLDTLGFILVRRGDWAGAESALRRALSLDPKLASARLSLAEALAGLGRRDDARREIDTVLGGDIDDTVRSDARALLDRLGLSAPAP